jgi:DNA repair exonuclease SbcCD ATPase subunit
MKTIRWKNFLSTGNVFTELKLNTFNNSLIIGDNGAGKSTLLDALSFALFGKAFRKINKPQLINTITQKNLIVEIEFSIGKTEYKVIRGIKPNVFELYKNDELLNQSSTSLDYQEILEKNILKVNHKSFCQVVTLGSATFQPFMQLSSGQRREVIEDLLDLQIFGTMNAIVKEKISNNSQQIQELNYNKKLVEEKIKMMKEHLKKIANDKDQMIKEKNNLIIDTDAQIQKLNDALNGLDEKKQQFENDVQDIDSLNKKMQKLSKLKNQIETKMTIVNDELTFFNSHDNCPTCKQSIDDSFKCETIKEKDTQLKEFDSGLSLLIEQYEDANAKLKAALMISDNLNDIKMEIHKVKTKINSLNDYKEQIQIEIKKLSKNTNETQTFNIDDELKQLKILENEYESLIEEKTVLACSASLLKDGGIKSKIIKQYIPIINKLINKYLSSMEFMCQFELDENFNETIKSRYRDDFSYSSFSEGEKMRINLAILFTWRAIAKMRNSINTNILIMDEVFDSSLDSTGTEEFLKIINSLTSDTNTFIISHKTDSLLDKFNNVIKFEKHHNFSRIAA